MGRNGAAARSRFEILYAASYQEITGYVRRRIAGPEADDVIAHVFTVAWHRIDRVPPPPEDRLWLFGVARNSVADHHRGERRRFRLRARLMEDAVTAAPAAAEPDARHEAVLAAIAALRPKDREALQLVLWEDLSHAEAAAVLGCSVNAFELRYRRARNAVRDAVTGPPPARDAGHTRLVPTTSRTESS